MTVAVRIESLSKGYQLGARDDSTQLRERLLRVITSPFKRRSSETHWIWALRDVSFNVNEGEVVGILGRNGAGKSTLLKVLSKITYPTSGRISVQGRVASLLEVGTGFHEELTGRENIYLNGSILGMRHRDVERRFDEIVEFSGVEQFIDTPIKRYSSGMRLRLGFAVAAHLDPDVLIVDEVLAVGDAGFQKKCIAAMENLRGGGRTVLFVSHNMAAVENLCTRGIWIDRGQVRMDAPATDAIKAYLASYGGETTSGPELQLDGRIGTGEIRFTKLEFLDRDGTPGAIIRSGGPLTMRLSYVAYKRVSNPSFAYRIFTGMGTMLTATSQPHHGITIPTVGPGEGFFDITIHSVTLVPGRYLLSFQVTSPPTGIPVYDGDVRAVLDIEPADVYGHGHAIDSKLGVIYFPQTWRLSDPTVRPTSQQSANAVTGKGS
jgi:lipopolysaccharide transport system ATP-binding protein